MQVRGNLHQQSCNLPTINAFIDVRVSNIFLKYKDGMPMAFYDEINSGKYYTV
jgi:hypothetical protein